MIQKDSVQYPRGDAIEDIAAGDVTKERFESAIGAELMVQCGFAKKGVYCLYFSGFLL